VRRPSTLPAEGVVKVCQPLSSPLSRYYVIFLDGVEVGRTDLMGLGSDEGQRHKSAGPCRQPGYLILSCEAAPWAGASPEWEQEMPAEDEFLVDYVRVYEGTLPSPTASVPGYSSRRWLLGD
jgi:hypothetical protein